MSSKSIWRVRMSEKESRTPKRSTVGSIMHAYNLNGSEAIFFRLTYEWRLWGGRESAPAKVIKG